MSAAYYTRQVGNDTISIEVRRASQRRRGTRLRTFVNGRVVIDEYITRQNQLTQLFELIDRYNFN